MIIKNAEFIISAAELSQIPPDRKEIAVAGKSNVGKSSFINFLCGKKLAKTSKDPGRTRLLNYFDINGGEFTLVDLPGYGYAKVAQSEKSKWAALLEKYFATPCAHKRHVLLLLDIRHDPTKEDLMMLEYMYYFKLPFTVIATKADKLSRAARARRRGELAASLKIGIDNIILVSSSEAMGKEQVLERLEHILSLQ
ncbi:MAG: ribosome biogenesis GTP-binding protein YihA/YsxC [Clostridia bacterium]|nr:ribosome biogenesis GTP-binding protein YihA/YsxC [Clostridia bacterium]